MKLDKIMVMGGCLATAVAVCFAAANDTYSPVANLTERWTNDTNWRIFTNATGSYGGYTNQAMMIRYQSAEPPPSGVGALVANSTASDGRFVGNYSNSAITHVAFRLMKTGCANAHLLFLTAKGDLWSYPFALPVQDRAWVDIVIPMTYCPEWKSMRSPSDFDTDRAQISNVWVYAQREGSGEQFVLVDDFKVLGPWEKGPMLGDVPIYWLRENGLPEQAGQDAADKDGDGFNNFAEYMAGSNPNDPADVFRVEIGKDAGARPVLRWRRANYRAYTVLRSDNLAQANSFVACTNVVDTNPVVSAAGKSEVVVNSQALPGPSFYRVAIQQQ
jgi:hypothetical protein